MKGHLDERMTEELQWLQNRLRELERERKLLKRIQSLGKTVDRNPFPFLSVAFALRKAFPEDFRRLEGLYEHALSVARKELDRYRFSLERELEQGGLDVKVEGSSGDYKVGGLVNVIIRFDEAKATCRAEVETCSRCKSIRVEGDISAASVAKVVGNNIKRLLEARFSDEEFLELLFRAYRAAAGVAVSGMVPPEVPVLDVYRQFIGCMQEDRVLADPERSIDTLRLDEFVVAIGRLLASGTVQTKEGARLKLHPGRVPGESVAITNLKELTRQNYRSISFVKNE